LSAVRERMPARPAQAWVTAQASRAHARMLRVRSAAHRTSFRVPKRGSACAVPLLLSPPPDVGLRIVGVCALPRCARRCRRPSSAGAYRHYRESSRHRRRCR
jgi:hypothetical protein